ncbi:U-box domain-containing protein 35-like [Triticum dicoccoides]|uniref:U-box domain-containing protein 35-like n=1 Tax=Triticum dicoccoides TaxID=85692 RepID=UPI001891E4E3|nr:U-box domain-containing protein 35-like [Triticum dicoccoides]
MAEAVRDDHRGAVGVAVDDRTNNGDSTWEIEELEPDDRTAGPPPPPPPGAAAISDADDVYVAVGKGGSSMAALSWALTQLARPRSFVYLVHVFPVVATIPTPLGMMPKRQATPEQVETYMNQERSKRREMLQKFLDHCRNFQVNVDVYLIESDQIADAVAELIPVLNIKQLVLGVAKSNLRKLKKGNTIAGQIQKNAPLYCEVKIVCDDKEVAAATTADPTPPFSPSPVNNNSRSRTPTPPSSTPNHNSIEAVDGKNDSKTKERRKVPKFLRCLSS